MAVSIACNKSTTKSKNENVSSVNTRACVTFNAHVWKFSGQSGALDIMKCAGECLIEKSRAENLFLCEHEDRRHLTARPIVAIHEQVECLVDPPQSIKVDG